MALMELKLLIFLQLSIDIAIFIAFVLLIKRLRTFNTQPGLQNGVKIFESVLADADKTALRFKEQLEEKNNLIQSLDKKLDKKIMSINVLLNRADALIADQTAIGGDASPPLFSSRQEKEIVKLAREGRDLDHIAGALAIPKGEVKLVLDLRNKYTQLRRKEGAS